MLIRVLSRMEIESDFYLTIKESSMPHIILSVTSDRANPIVNIKENTSYKGVLRFQFDDIDIEHKKCLITNNKSTKYNIFYAEHAKSILNFVNTSINDIEAIISHCDAGVSRSSAMAAALSKILNNEDDFFFKNYIPNMLVYSTILNEYYYNTDKYPNLQGYFYKHLPKEED